MNIFRKPSVVISDTVSDIQKDLDAEHGIRPINEEPRDFYRKLGEVPESRWTNDRSI
jgi:hypothetical protein